MIRPEFVQLSSSLSSLEVTLVELRFPSSKRSCIVGSLYRPPSSSSVLFLKDLTLLVDTIYTYSDDLLLMGDLNFDFLKSLDSSISDSFALLRLQNLVTLPTRVTATSASLLDVVLSSIPERFSKAISLDSRGLSDHHLVGCARILSSPSWSFFLYLAQFSAHAP